MSASRNLVQSRIVELQTAINERALGNEFELKQLFNDWDQAVIGANLSKSITEAFKRRIRGYPKSVDPVLTNVQIGDVRANGRERMFVRRDGDHTEEPAQ